MLKRIQQLPQISTTTNYKKSILINNSIYFVDSKDTTNIDDSKNTNNQNINNKHYNYNNNVYEYNLKTQSPPKKIITIETNITDLYFYNHQLIVQSNNVFYVYIDGECVNTFSLPSIPIATKVFDKIYFLVANEKSNNTRYNQEYRNKNNETTYCLYYYSDALYKKNINIDSSLNTYDYIVNFYISGPNIYFLTSMGCIYKLNLNTMSNIDGDSILEYENISTSFSKELPSDLIVYNNKIYISYKTGVEVYSISYNLKLLHVIEASTYKNDKNEENFNNLENDIKYKNSTLDIFKSNNRIFLLSNQLIDITLTPKIYYSDKFIKILPDNHFININNEIFVELNDKLVTTKYNYINEYPSDYSINEKIDILFRKAINLRHSDKKILEQLYNAELLKIYYELESLNDSFEEKQKYITELKNETDEKQLKIEKKKQEVMEKIAKYETIEFVKKLIENNKNTGDLEKMDLEKYKKILKATKESLKTNRDDLQKILKNYKRSSY